MAQGRKRKTPQANDRITDPQQIKLGLYSITYLGLWYREGALTLPELLKAVKRFGYPQKPWRFACSPLYHNASEHQQLCNLGHRPLELAGMTMARPKTLIRENLAERFGDDRHHA